MTRKLKSMILSLVTAAGFAVPLAVPATVGAADTIQTSVCNGAVGLDLTKTPGCPTGQGSNFDAILSTIINIFSVIVGIVAVIMIIVGGLRYITSGGDSTKVGNAKNAILYAIIGLIIVALAQLIVKFVLSKATGGG